MRGDAWITVTCDSCGIEDDFQLTATARGGWDDRDLDERLRNAEWVSEGEKDYCSEECLEDAQRLAGVQVAGDAI